MSERKNRPRVMRIARSLLKGVGFLLAIMVILVGYFRWEAAQREVKTNREVAPTNGRYLLGNDVEVFVQDSGNPDGQPLIFIHGTGAWGEIWRETVEPLNAAGYRTILVDLPPFGHSERPTDESYTRADQAKRILAILDELDLETATLVGHSFGGGPTVETALLAPERIDQLILLDVGDTIGPLPFSDRPTEPGLVGKIAGVTPLRNGVLATFVTNPRMTRRLLQMIIHNPAAATDGRVAMLQQPAVIENSTHDLGIWLLANFLLPQPEMATNNPDNYQRLTMPVLLIWGEEDTLTPLEQGVYMQEVIAGSELVQLPGIGHVPQVEAPEKVAEVLLHFLEENR